ncbi:hypothetical protein AB8813_09120 [Xanthomonas arboricola pv. corylina]|uniref:hypothetical protein n=1 Tax=Xanthomonas arboricola TaxID=56448 RepID=UPI0021581874|nr:hypothetical protein [Xanthomonas arboricola]
MASKFGDQVRAFAEKSKQRQTAIFRESAQAVMDQANTPKAKGGKMPVDTGTLLNSRAASKDGPATSESGDPALIFAALQLGEAVWAGWTAAYAMRMEHGFSGKDSLGRQYEQAGNGFMRAAAQNWDFIVNEVTAKVKARIP